MADLIVAALPVGTQTPLQYPPDRCWTSPIPASASMAGWNQDDYDVLFDGVLVGRIFKVPIAPEDRHWMWASGHNGDLCRAVHGCEPTREAAMADAEPGASAKTTIRVLCNNEREPSMPPIVVLALGALAAGALIHRAVKEMQRINED